MYWYGAPTLLSIRMATINMTAMYRGLDQPVVEKSLDVVVGSRPIEDIEHFSFLKKRLQGTGRQLYGSTVLRHPDTGYHQRFSGVFR